VGTVITSI